MATRGRRRGFGAVRKLPSKRWQASYIGPDQVRHNAPETFQTKADAEGWLGRQQGLIASERWEPPKPPEPPTPTITFGAYAETWLHGRALKPKTREFYAHLLTKYLLPVYETTELIAITPAGVRQWWGKLDPSTPTVNARAYALLKTILNTAVADDVISANPCRIRGASNTARLKDVRPASIPELEVIMTALPANRRCLALLCAWCALRIGEALELRRGDIDPVRGTISVERAVSWVHGKPVIGSPKSAAGRRTVHIPPHVLPALADHLRDWTGPGRHALLFPAGDGISTLHPSVFHAAWEKARRAAGRDDLRVHDLRHTGATLAAMTGATLAELQQRLGHSSVNAALRYQHAAQGRDAQIAAALSAMVDPAHREHPPAVLPGGSDARPPAHPSTVLLSTSEAGAFLGISRTAVIRRVETGQLKEVRVGPSGRNRRFRLSELMAYRDRASSRASGS